MIGQRRLDNIRSLVERILHDGIRGDFIEAGVWRGGSTIFMRGLLKAYGVTDRTVWVADSFGLGLPTAEQGASDRSYSSPNLDLVWEGTSFDDVRERFGRYDLLDDQVRFLRGYAIVDDYGTFLECRQAIHDYLDTIGETPNITEIDDEAVYWQRQ